MGVVYGSSIVTDGLVFCVDAASKRSYSGGSEWVDLVNSNNGTLTNGPTFSHDNGGTINFDGSNDYVQFETSSVFDFDTGNFSVEAWFNLSYDTTYHHIFTLQDQNNFSLKRTRSNEGGGKDNSIYAYAGSATTSTYSTIICTTTVDQWHHIFCVRDGSDFRMYLDNEFKGEMTNWGSESIGGASAIPKIGWGWSSEYTLGMIPLIRVYNKALTANEVRQNYLATKGRFGL